MKKLFRRSLAWILSFTTLFVAIPRDWLIAALVENGIPESQNVVMMNTDESQDNPNDYLYDIVEINELRGENSKHFRREDGSFSVVSYDVAVHYQISDGTWAEIDNRLTLTDRSSYTSSNGPVIKHFSQKLDTGLLFSEQFKDYSLALTIENNTQTGQKEYFPAEAKLMEMSDEHEMDPFDAIATPDYLSQTILYPGVYDGVDFSYESYSNNIKENITLLHVQESYMYSFMIEAGELLPKSVEDGGICFCDEAGDVVFTITAPYMIDAEGLTSDQVHYELTEVETLGDNESSEEAPADEDNIISENEELTITVESEVDDLSSAVEETYAEDSAEDNTEANPADNIVEKIGKEIRTENESGIEKDTQETSGGRKYRLIMRLDEDWLNDPERAFPVIIDPSLEVSSGTSSADITSTYVVEGTPTTKQSNYQSLYVGYGVNSKAKRQPIFLHVNNLPSLPDNCLPVAAYLGYYQPSTRRSKGGKERKRNELIMIGSRIPIRNRSHFQNIHQDVITESIRGHSYGKKFVESNRMGAIHRL